MSASLKIWAWLHLSHTQNLGVATTKSPFLTFLESTTVSESKSFVTVHDFPYFLILHHLFMLLCILFACFGRSYANA